MPVSCIFQPANSQAKKSHLPFTVNFRLVVLDTYTYNTFVQHENIHYVQTRPKTFDYDFLF